MTTTPELDLQATTHIRDYDITLSLNGEPNKLRVTYRSEPPLPEADIVAISSKGLQKEALRPCSPLPVVRCAGPRGWPGQARP